jgi:hypothetical protein
VKNLFGIVPINVFQLSVIYKWYRQVLTPIHNAQVLLKLPILDKFRLETLHTCATQRNYSVKTGMNQFRRNEISHDLDSCRIISEDERRQAHTVFTMTLSSDISAGQVKQLHYHEFHNK